MEKPSERRGRGKPRDENLREAILTASWELLLEKGFRRFTIEGVAARSGASKVTIYKWTRSKGALAFAGYVHGVTDAITFPETDSPRDDVERQVAALIETLTSPAGKALVELIGAAQDDPELQRELTTRYIQPRRELAARAFGRLLGWDPNERERELNAITDQVYGAVYNRLLFGLTPLDADFARELVAFWIP